MSGGRIPNCQDLSVCDELTGFATSSVRTVKLLISKDLRRLDA